MENFVNDMANHLVSNRKVAVIENGTWAPSAKDKIVKALENCKNLTFLNTKPTVKSRLKQEDIPALEALADEIINA